MIPDEADSLLEGCPECGNQRWEYIKESDDEDKTQEKARTELVGKDELPTDSSVLDALQNPTGDIDFNTTDETEIERVNDIEAIQDNLNEQYEGIRVVKNGKYEINLTELYRGNNYFIEVGEDGAYEVREATE